MMPAQITDIPNMARCEVCSITFDQPVAWCPHCKRPTKQGRTETHVAPTSSTPGIATALDVVGWVLVIISILIAAFGGLSGQYALAASAAGGIAFGFVFLGLGAIIALLGRIEHNVRP